MLFDFIKRKKVLSWSLFFLFLEIVSFCVYKNIFWNNVVVVILGLGILVLTYKKPLLSFILVIVELVLGGFGYWFVFTFGDHRISERMIFMGSFLLGWLLWRVFKKNKVINWKKYWEKLKYWILILGLILFAFVLGYWHGYVFLFKDVNAWLFLFYIVPIADFLLNISIEQKARLKNDFINIFLAGLIVLAFKVLITFFLFAHGFLIIDSLYTWIRDTRIGEITPAGGGLYRVFFQSAIYIVLALVMMLPQVWEEKKNTWSFSILFVFFLSVLIISLSRSFWLAFGIVLIGIYIYFAWIFKKLFIKKIVLLFLWLVASLGFLSFLILLPVNKNNSQIALSRLLVQRTDLQDEAISSRWNLLPIMLEAIKGHWVVGYGFGKTLEYKSNDPRIRQQNSEGYFRTYAFEWGWLSFMLKFGLIGVFVFIFWLGSIFWNVKGTSYDKKVKLGIYFSGLLLVVVHFFTPYLNHPLGFGWLILIQSLFLIDS